MRTGEIELNGRRMRLGSKATKKIIDSHEVWEVVEGRSCESITLAPSDELVVDGVVVVGTKYGKRVEERRVGKNGKLLRRVYYTGEHADACEHTDDGWVCRKGCSVRDDAILNDYSQWIDTLIEVVQECRREGWHDRFRARWTISRQSYRRHFVNGRCAPSSSMIVLEIWHQGSAWTKRKARKQMHAFLET